jgi:hypothetical protein
MRSSRTAVLSFILCCATLSAAVTVPKFFARRDYPAGAAGYYVYVGDVTGDGIPDVVDVGPQYQIVALQGYGNGTFHSAVTTNVDWQLISGAALVDLNGDSKQDLILGGTLFGNGGSGAMGVMFSNGDGTFQPVVLYSVSDKSLGNPVVGDFNGRWYTGCCGHWSQRHLAVYRERRRRF